MNLKTISDHDLLSRTEHLVREERELLTQILHHLREIESRRLFSQLKYKSLFDYAVRHLKYSADQAARRIFAMRLLRDLPEIESKIEAGELSLTNLSLAQNFFRKEQLPRTERLKVLDQLQNQSSREAEKIVLNLAANPMAVQPDRVRQVTPSHIEVKFIADEKLAAALERLKGLLAHRQTGLGIAEIVQTACEIAIEKLTPTSHTARTLRAPKRRGDGEIPQRHRKHIPAPTRREVWAKAAHACQNCGSVHALQVVHVKPLALGGADEAENLRLLCRPCNQRAAIETFGRSKMERFLEKRRI